MASAVKTCLLIAPGGRPPSERGSRGLPLAQTLFSGRKLDSRLLLDLERRNPSNDKIMAQTD